MIINDDCLEAMKKMEDNSIDFIVTDPPYGLRFMGKRWDYAIPDESYWREMLRILKPGGHLAAMGGSRTFHRLATKIEDSGFEIRDCIMWLYGSGFPKSHNDFGLEGYGTALKPAHEPILLCKKPYEISSLFVTILLDITNEVYKCQKLNYNVNDAETNLSDTLLLLDKVHQSIVQENVKTYAWEKLADVQYVIQNFTSLDLELKEKINQAKELFALISAKDNHNASTRDQKILAGEVECIFASIQDIVIFATMEHTKQNIVLLWKNILIGIFQGLNKFTIRTVINLITELRILKSCLHPNILNDIGSLCPNYEPIILAMKPLDGTFAHNAEKWGLGGINIDDCRVEGNAWKSHDATGLAKTKFFSEGEALIIHKEPHEKGRWPANLILDEEAGEMLDEQSGVLKGSSGNRRPNGGGKMFKGFAPMKAEFKSDSGGASRFFYCAKTSSKERQGSTHPTMKPLALMRYIIKLLAPPNDPLLLDPFCGSGSTLIAAKELEIRYIGIDKEVEYCEIAQRRLDSFKAKDQYEFKF